MKHFEGDRKHSELFIKNEKLELESQGSPHVF